MTPPSNQQSGGFYNALSDQQWSSWQWFLFASGTALLAVPTRYLYVYRKSIRRRVKDIETRLAQGIIIRDTTGKAHPSKVVRALELHPPFVEKASKEGWQLSSLGQYLSSLRINNALDGDKVDLPKTLERELQVTIGSTLMRSLGPRLGAAVLPILGVSKVDTWMGRFTTSIASYVASHIVAEVSDQWDPTQDRAAFPFTVGEIISFININQKVQSPALEGPSSLAWMQRGEVGYTPTFATLDDEKEDSSSKEEKDKKDSSDTESPPPRELLPNPFCIEQHYQEALDGMENRIRAHSRVTATQPSPNAGDATVHAQPYDPMDRSLPPPTPVNSRLLPDLYLGWGDAQCTHTKLEILRNRLFAVLFTKLSYNYKLLEEDGENADLFVVEYHGTKCTFPDQFLKALQDNGHEIQVCPRSTITTFGLAACVKNADESWTNIPFGFFFRTGYENKDGRPAYFAAPHGGLDMKIEGPLVGSGNKCDIQFYVAIEGLCAWHSNHNADVPWIKPVATTEVYDSEMALQAVRMAGLLGVTFNALATELKLPFGGYGVLGVCNDSAAFIDFAVRKETNMYPLVSTGRFLFHCARRLLQLKEGLAKCPEANDAIYDTRRLVMAACNMDSDIHNSPRQLVGTTRRYLANNPVSFFQLTEDSKQMVSSVAKVYEEFVDLEMKTLSAPENDSRLLPEFVDYLFRENNSRKT